MNSNSKSPTGSGKTWLLFFNLALLLLVTGCISQHPEMTSGRHIDADKVAQIVKGKTTRAEVEVMFGKPDMTSLLPDGRRSLSYNYSNTKTSINGAKMMFSAMTGSGSGAQIASQTQSLQIFVSKDGVVEDYEFNDHTRDTVGSGNGTTTTTTR